MIELVLDHTDLARVRFAHSAVRELVTSLLVLQDPSRRVMHGRWLAAVRPRLSGLRLELLTALAPVSGPYLPQFLLPTVGRPWPVLAEELDAIAASPAELVRSELEQAYHGRLLVDTAPLLSAFRLGRQRHPGAAVCLHLATADGGVLRCGAAGGDLSGSGGG